MVRSVLTAVLLAATLVPVQAGTVTRSPVLHHLDRDGSLSAGWLDVLPKLASACNLRLDNQRLTAKLIDLSRREGNLTYTRDLYETLERIELRTAENQFDRVWLARFDGRQKDACNLAEDLWGDKGRQFPGVLTRDATSDASTALSAATQANCK